MSKMALDYVIEIRMKAGEKDNERFSVDVDKTEVQRMKVMNQPFE
jgi:hypothetical protein